MKTTLTIEQSAELIKRGVSKDKASMVCLDFNGTYAYVCGEESHTVRDCVNGQFYVEESRVFSLSDLLSLLPKELYGEETDYCDCELHIHANKIGWSASYMEIRGSEVVVMKLTSYGFELIDALFSLLCKLLDNHVKLD